jgi:2-dehydropantoate 2-reductase
VTQKVGVIGPGAIGGTVAAWLGQKHEVFVAARTSFEELRVETPTGVLVTRPFVLTDPERAYPVDWLLCATKAYDAPAAASWLAHARRSETPLAVLQNGVEHVERFAPHVPRERILPVVVDCSAERVASGHILQRSRGTLLVPAGELGRAFVELFSHTELVVATTEDFVTEAWKKLCLNAGGAVSAVLAGPTNVARHVGVAGFIRGVVLECVRVGRAEGARLSDELVDEIVERQASAADGSFNSLSRDRRAGRPMEIDARNGVIVRLGRKHDLSTPLNEMLVALLEASERLIRS